MTCLVLLPGMDGTGSLFSQFVAALGAPIKPVVVAYPPDQVLDSVQLEAHARERLPASEPFVLLLSQSRLSPTPERTRDSPSAGHAL